ncbi:hypothetical protein GCM10018781_03740 [Kitasatospora indigofera]|uniref:Uncharacterized protein n=1 Tax=Kitasatospora indigofera TaxID=67307 RepID=A0A919KKI7_9ACTN|nr:hypothetical protein GCM10018781_03740 [Kitasatospora indigofera]
MRADHRAGRPAPGWPPSGLTAAQVTAAQVTPRQNQAGGPPVHGRGSDGGRKQKEPAAPEWNRAFRYHRLLG